MKGLFETMMSGLPAVQAKSTDISALTWEAILGTPSTKSGVSVNLDTALRVTTVLACCRVIAEGVSQLPLHVGREADDGAFEIQRNDPYFKLLARRPNDWMSPFELRETLTYNAVLTGFGFAYKNRLRGQVAELLPVATSYCNWQREPKWGWLVHCADPYGLQGTYRLKDFLVVRGPSWDGVLPFNIMRLAREAIGLAIATEAAHARLHANGAQPGGIISFDGALGEEARQKVKDRANQLKRSGAFETLVLDLGAKYTQMAMTGVDAQHLETRRLQIEEVCRAFRVFPHMVGYSDKAATFASAESFFQGHVLHTLMPWLIRWQEALYRDVTGDRDLIARFDVRELLKGDTVSRGNFYATGIVNGWLTRNDARRMEGLSPLPGLDDPLAPLNMSPVGQAVDAAETPSTAKRVKMTALAQIRDWVKTRGGAPQDVEEISELIAVVANSITAALDRAA